MDWQKMIMDLVGVVFMALVTFSWKAYIKPFAEEYVKPWLITHNLMEAARIAVSAAEALYGRYNGADKLKAAMKQLEDKGWNINSDVVVNAVNAAWEELNINQIAAGVKNTQEPEEEN